MNSDPHGNQPVLQQGSALDKASGLIIFLHGRGGSSEDIMTLSHMIGLPGLAYLAPDAANNTWYPTSFLSPLEENQPWLSSALKKVETLVQSGRDAGLGTERIAICGFSQGACLATEFAATHPARYAGIIAFTGGLIGHVEADLVHRGDLQQTPVFLGSSDPDAHVPFARVQRSAEILTGMNAAVTLQRYPGMPHTISRDGLEQAHRMMEGAFK